MRPLKLLLVLAILAIAAGGVFAEESLVIRPANLEGKLTPYNFGPNKDGFDQGAPSDCCRVGNLNWYGHVIENFISGGESYSYLFDVNPVCACETGFTFYGVHMMMQFGPEDVPVTLEVSAAFEETMMDLTGDMVPGPPICSSPVYSGTITEPGGYNIYIPLTQANCQCAEFGYAYAASVTFHNQFQNKPDLIVDYYPVGGVSWLDQGRGWVDMSSQQLPGEAKITAKLECCSTPVSDDRPSWGKLKAMFR